MDNYEGEYFEGNCPACRSDVDFLTHFYDYEVESGVDVWACFSCEKTVKVNTETEEIVEVYDLPD